MCSLMCSGIKPFRCVICDARFPIREYLVNHMVCHTTDRKYKCDVCSATFFRQSNLSSHMISHTGNNACMVLVSAGKENILISTPKYGRVSVRVFSVPGLHYRIPQNT
ncbi:hypothetical protein DPMN_158762 [Dreissena polymorpha]|uniref:C2H2-type domain-containing protein n=1 Tax=Dreissena polymorpha TaxID=45954 RepID=A0A9D4IQ40_DREPO|nr:hypothetical protein DPMN_158762 [Dreissena polymorpha]